MIQTHLDPVLILLEIFNVLKIKLVDKRVVVVEAFLLESFRQLHHTPSGHAQVTHKGHEDEDLHPSLGQERCERVTKENHDGVLLVVSLIRRIRFINPPSQKDFEHSGFPI